MTLVRQPILRAPPERLRERTATDSNSSGHEASEQHEGEELGDTALHDLAQQFGKLSKRGIERAAKNLSRATAKGRAPWESTRDPLIRGRFHDGFQRGSQRPCLYSQPLPRTLTLHAQPRCGLILAAPLRRKLAPHLARRPKKGLGYIVERGDELDDLLDEAYDEPQPEHARTLLEYNRHLGLSEPEALEAAIGRLLFFPELEELLALHEAEAELGHHEFPAIEAFLELAGLPPEAASALHWVADRFPKSDANLSTSGKPFAFQNAPYNARGVHDVTQTEIPEPWVHEGMSPEMHNARINADKPYIRTLLASGRYTMLRG